MVIFGVLITKKIKIMATYDITETVTKKVEVKFPTYTETHGGNIKWAVISEKNIICVQNWDWQKDICTNRAIDAAFDSSHRIITAHDFATFYKQTATQIWEQCESFLDMLEEKRHDAQVDYDKNDDPGHEETMYQQNQQSQ